MTKLHLAHGRIYDPLNGVDGKIGDLWIAEKRIVAEPPPEDRGEFSRVDLQGRVVMPGGVDMHSHIVGPKVNAGRKMQPELYLSDYSEGLQHLRGYRELPSIGQTALNYLTMGYTTAVDAAIPPSSSRYVHHELEHFPGVDAGFFTLVGNNHFVMDAASRRDVDATRTFLRCLLNRCRSLAPKIVNPGGVENWKARRTGSPQDLRESVDGFGTTPQAIIQILTEAANDLGLPHPVHLHCNNLGLPGNWQTTLETMKSITGLRAHFTHIQFHSYGGSDVGNMESAVETLAEFINEHPEHSVDVGQILFGKTTSMTGDGPLGHLLSQINGKKWYSSDTEVESGCGVSPIEYSDRQFIHGLQWCIGLEWYLKVKNPWQVVMSTDHPNGASFMAYPHIIRLLMDREFRREALESLPARVRKRCRLAEMEREYSLQDIAIITRAGPAKLLGLSAKGHLGVDADADITVYTHDQNAEEMFSTPWMVIKGGEVVIQDHEWRGLPGGSTWYAASEADEGGESRLADWFNRHYSFDYARFGISEKTDGFQRERKEARWSRPENE